MGEGTLFFYFTKINLKPAQVLQILALCTMKFCLRVKPNYNEYCGNHEASMATACFTDVQVPGLSPQHAPSPTPSPSVDP